MSGSAGLTVLALVVILVVTLLAVGLTLVVLSRRGARGRGHPACGGCGYDVSGLIGRAERCPECGRAFAEVGIEPPRGPRRPTLAVAGIAILAITLLLFGGTMLSVAGMARARAAQARAQALAARAAAQAAQAQAAAVEADARAAEADATVTVDREPVDPPSPAPADAAPSAGSSPEG